MNTKEKLNQFLNNNEIRELWLNRKDFKPTNYDDIIRLFKLNFGRFDYIYGMENIKNNKPTHYSNPYFCGVIDTKNNDLYILSYNINQIDTDIKFISKNMLDNKLQEMLTQAYEKFAKDVIDDLPENAIYYNRSHAEDDFYYGKTNEYAYNFNLHERDTNELLTFIENPKEYIDTYIKTLELDGNKLTKYIKECKLQKRLSKQYLSEIETQSEYHYLRLARKLKESIPENAKTVTLFYKLDNDEILECKLETSALNYVPYSKGENIHFSYYSINKQARDKMEEINGKKYNDIYIKNILKVTYKGKTIFENN